MRLPPPSCYARAQMESRVDSPVVKLAGPHTGWIQAPRLRCDGCGAVGVTLAHIRRPTRVHPDFRWWECRDCTATMNLSREARYGR